MNLQAKIVFTHEQEIKGNEYIHHFMKNSTDDFSLFPYGEELLAVVKDIDPANQTLEKIRCIAGSISRKFSLHKVTKVSLQKDALIKAFSKLKHEDTVIAFTEGWYLGTYQFVTYKSSEEKFFTTLEVCGNDKEELIKAGETRAVATAFARDLTNELSSELNPETFPIRLQTEFANTDVQVTVFNKEEIEKREMNGVLTVSRGSKYEPTFVEMAYCGDQTKPLVALVGKGVTFDTGGISLKKGRDISDMRMDMGGAAAVAGAMKLLATAKAKVNVVALIPIVENMPDSNSMLPGEVIRYKNGHTVQVGNTDAEGRLILADGLIRAGELNASYVVDIATLTGSIWSALGSRVAGVFGDEQLQVEMKKLGDKNGDYNWPMPLIDAYDDYLKSDYADFSNISSKGEAGAVTAALFLRRFVPKPCKWLHVDMAGVMYTDERGYYVKGATGFGARLLADYAIKVSE